MSEHFLKVLRNGELFASHKLALTGLEKKLGGLTDGEIAVASYGDSFANAKTIFGVVRVSGGQKSYEIFDNEGKTSEVSTKIAEEIAKLDADVTSADGGKVKVNVVEVDGKITEVTVTESDIASAAKLTEVEGKVDNAQDKADANETAIAVLNGVDTVEGSVAKSIKDAIEGLDVGEFGGEGKVITTISETDGKIAATAIDLKAENVAATEITGDNAKVGVTGTTVAEQIESLAGSIKTVEGNTAKYVVTKVTDNLAANVREAYKLQSFVSNGEKSDIEDSATINIYKDASLVSANFVTEDDEENKGQFLKLVYNTSEGNQDIVYVDISKLVAESEFKNGLVVSDAGEVSVQVDFKSESFLTVSEDGVKLSGVQNAINSCRIAATTTVAHDNGNTHVTVSSAQNPDGHYEYIINETNIASAALLGTADDTADKGTAFGKIAANKAAIDALSGDVIKTVEVNGVEAEVDGNVATVTIDGNDIAVADEYTAVEYAEPFNSKTGVSKVGAEDKVDAAFAKVEGTVKVLVDEVIANEEVVSKAVEKLATAAGTIDVYDNISYTQKTDANYIKDATSLHDATVKLDEALKIVADSTTTAGTDMLISVVAGDGISVTEKSEKSQTISAKLNTTKTDNALSVDANGLYLSNVWDCGTY